MNPIKTPTPLWINALRACLASVLAFHFSNNSVLRAADNGKRPIKQAADGSITLGAANGKIDGPNARLEGGAVKDIMWWTSADTSLRWTASLQKPGHYRVEIIYAIVGNNNGSPLAIMIGDQIVKAIPKAGTSFNDYTTAKAGEVAISKAGDYPVIVKPLSKAREFVITIRSVSLLPAETPTEAIDIGSGVIKQSADDSFKLTAGDADITGMNAQLEAEGEKNIGFWQDVDTSLIWSIHVEKPGNYRVEIAYSLQDSSTGSKIAITVGDQTIKAQPTPTKGWTDYKIGKAGEVTIDKTGDIPVVVKPISKPGGFVMNLRSISLLPAETPTKAININDKPVTQETDGSLKLTALDAEIDGQSARIEGGEKKYLAWWNSPERVIKWPVKIDKPGTFHIQCIYALRGTTSVRQIQFDDDGTTSAATLPATVSDSSEIEIFIGGQNVAATLKAGEGWDDFKTEVLGDVTVEKSDQLEVILKSTREIGTVVMHLRSLSLIPVKN